MIQRPSRTRPKDAASVENADIDQHQRLTNRAIELLGKLIQQNAGVGATGTIGIEVDMRGGLARVVRQKTSTTEI